MLVTIVKFLVVLCRTLVQTGKHIFRLDAAAELVRLFFYLGNFEVILVGPCIERNEA
jgi:hypothetical protein